MKKVLFVLTIGMMMAISCENKEKRLRIRQKEADSVVERSTGTEEKEVVAFLISFYKEMEGNAGEFSNHSSSSLSLYMVKSAMEKLLVESDYEEDGDSYFYDLEFFIDGKVSGSQHGDYNAPISRDISLDEGHWYKIYTEFANNNPAPTLIKVKVEKFGDKYMITDIQLNE